MRDKNIIIVGAPRSGTNMLRDVLAALPEIVTWPCDEINYIWRHGNIRYPSDEFPTDLANSRVIRYIQGQFDALRRSRCVKIVLEKTCANSLRVPFVDRVLPDAKYIYLYRDGIDTTGSAKLRWTAKLDIAYVLKKVRYVPLADLPYYGARYVWNRIYRFFSLEKRLAFWGPALDGMNDILKKYSIDEVCALQWQRCVEKAEAAFSEMPKDKVIRICYEDFVHHPKMEFKRIVEFIGIETNRAQIDDAVSRVSSKSIGKGRSALRQDQILKLEALIGDSLDRYGYRI